MGKSMGTEKAEGGTMGGHLVLVDLKDANKRTPIFLTSRLAVMPSKPDLPAGRPSNIFLGRRSNIPLTRYISVG